MGTALGLQFKSAEHLVNCAAELIMDAAGVLKDAGDCVGMQRLEELAVTTAAEVRKLQQRRAVIEDKEGEIAA